MWPTSVVITTADNTGAPAPLKGTVADCIRNAATIGYDAVQLTINRPHEFPLSEALTALQRHGLKASGIATGGAYAVDGLSLGHQSEDIRQQAVQRMRDHIDLAVKLDGADVIIGHIRGQYADGGSEASYLRQYDKSIAACVEYAERRAIRIVHEAIGRTHSDVLRTIADNVAFIQRIDSPYLKLHIDSHHMILEESDFRSAVLAAGDLVAQVDISGPARALPDGEGFDFPGLLSALEQIGYRDHLIFEFNAVGDGVAEATQGLRYIQSIGGSRQPAGSRSA